MDASAERDERAQAHFSKLCPIQALRAPSSVVSDRAILDG
jgi:hypothetical protein